MATRIDFTKLTAELTKLADLDRLKAEARKLQKEVQNFDINAHLTPKAKARIKLVESRYKELQRGWHRTQRNIDREIEKALRTFKAQREQADSALEMVKSLAREKTKTIESVARQITKGWGTETAKRKRPAKRRSHGPSATRSRSGGKKAQ